MKISVTPLWSITLYRTSDSRQLVFAGAPRGLIAPTVLPTNLPATL
jgi:hypothetical protein